MFEEFYGLRADPFRLSPDHAYCLRHPSFAKARAYMQFAVQRAEGFVMITGRPGTGKTTLIEDVLEQIGGGEVVAAKLVSAQLEADDLLRMVAFNFGIGAQGRDKSSLLMEIQGFLADRIAGGQRPLLVIDEAQGLSLKAIEELRLLTNLRLNGQPMLQIFLVGQEELRDLVLDPRMEQLHQRLIASCHLEPLSLEETAAYVMHRLKVAGWHGNPRLRPRLFPVLHRFSRGIPRRINLFMGRLLMHGWLEEKTELTLEDAETILGELRSEHLAPVRADSPLTPDEAAIDLESEERLEALVSAPDQKIGGKLLERGGLDLRFRGNPDSPGIHARPRTGASAKPVPAPAGSVLPGGPVNRLLTEESVPDPSDPPPPLAELTTSRLPPRRRGLFWGLGFSLAAAGLVFATAAATVPLNTSGEGALGVLLRASGIADLRRHLNHWTGGQFPILMAPAPKGDGRDPEQGSVALPAIRGRSNGLG